MYVGAPGIAENGIDEDCDDVDLISGTTTGTTPTETTSPRPKPPDPDRSYPTDRNSKLSVRAKIVLTLQL